MIDIEYICEEHPRVFLDTKKVLGPWARAATYIKINNREYERSKDFIDDHLKNKIIQTLGSRGCLYRGDVYPTKSIETIDLSGAGDTFLACLAISYTKHKDIKKAIEFGNRCATKVCKKKGTSIIIGEKY